MNKRLSELFDEIDPKEIESIEIELENEESKLSRGEEVSMERIKRLAMKGVEEEISPQVSSIEEHLKKRKKLFRRALLSLVAAVSLSIGTIAATHYSETISSLFGQMFPYRDQVQSINEQMSASGLVFTAEGAFIDDKTGLFIASFTKEDGTEFMPGTEVGNIRLEIDKPNAMGWGVYNQLSEDKKKLICMVDVSSSQKLHGNALNLHAENIRAWRDTEIMAPVNLAQVQKMPIEGNWKNYDSSSGLKIGVSEGFEQVILDRVYISDEGLSIITSFPDLEGIEDKWVYLSLENQKTGEIIAAAEEEHYWSEEEGLNKDYAVFKNIKGEDLAHLALKVKIQYNELITEGNWNVDFKLDHNSQVKTKKLHQVIEAGDGKLLIKKIQLSALGVTIQGRKISGDSLELKEAYLELKNGSRINLWQQGMNSGMGGFNLYLKASGGENMQETEQEQSMEITDKDSTTFSMESGDFDWNQFIDIEEVQNIVINGKSISLV